MQILKHLGAAVTLGVVIAACGGGNAPTQAPGATPAGGNGGNGGTATQVPAATQGGGGGGGLDTSHGKATFTVSGPISASHEYAFIPAGSLFGGAQGSVFNFGDTSGADANILSIIVSPDGSILASFSGSAGQVPAAQCTTSDWDVGATEAKGKFDCTAAFSITSSGATVEGGTIKGEFTARS
jgi:hypothetical protein